MDLDGGVVLPEDVVEDEGEDLVGVAHHVERRRRHVLQHLVVARVWGLGCVCAQAPRARFPAGGGGVCQVLSRAPEWRAGVCHTTIGLFRVMGDSE